MAETFASRTGDDTPPTNGLTFWTKALEDMQKRFTGSLDDGGQRHAAHDVLLGDCRSTTGSA